MLPIPDYHQAAVQFFKNQPTVWNFFAQQSSKDQQLKEFKTDLLKNTYKFDETSHAELYDKVKLAKEKLGLNIPVTLYQAQHIDEMNATIVYIDKEAHIVFSGKMVDHLTDEEMLAIIAHELSHVLLYTQQQEEVEVADRIVTAIANNPGCTSAHYETARLFKLYTEIFCDRGAYQVTGTYEPLISSLVKISTGLQKVNADSYIKQAEEIFTHDEATRTNAISHPENFIRARAIALWHEKKDESSPAIRNMIEGQMSIDALDLFHQQQISTVTEKLIAVLLTPKWMQTEKTNALAKQYFSEFTNSAKVENKLIAEEIASLHPSTKDYLTYVLYDFATVDKILEDVPLGYCFYLADQFALDKSFAQVVKKEMKLSEKKLATLKKNVMKEFETQSPASKQLS